MRAYGLAALRLCIAAIFVAHGAQKLLGLWGGPGLAGTAHMLAGLGLPYPYPLAILLALAEFGGGIMLILGWLTTWVGLALAVDMAVAIWKVHYRHGFFLTGGSGGQGFEYTLALSGALLCLVLGGPGALSLDEWRSQSAAEKARGRARARKV